jgi:hypothetical protein
MVFLAVAKNLQSSILSRLASAKTDRKKHVSAEFSNISAKEVWRFGEQICYIASH